MQTIYVRVLSEDQWLGAWAPIDALPYAALPDHFLIANNDLTEDDEYEFFQPGTIVRVTEQTDEQGNSFLDAIEAVSGLIDA